MASKAERLARIERILKRQSRPAWGRDYTPAIFATRFEAPRCSRPTTLKSAKLGRDMHLLSTPEESAAILALYHPGVSDVHEQHMLSAGPTFHPLASHPSAVGKQLTRIEGTITVAARLGKLAWHGKLFLEEENKWIPDIYVGDLLLICTDSSGVYCVNWTVKASSTDFHRSGPRPFGKPQKKNSERAAFRHDLEEAYFTDAGIRTQRVAGDAIDATLARNLEHLFRWHADPIHIPETERDEISAAFKSSIGTRIPAYTLVRNLATRYGASEEAIKALLHHDIWARRLRIDLFSPFVIDKPLRAEVRDPIDVYSAWFARQ